MEIGNYKSLKYRLTNTKLPNTFLVLGLVVNPAFNEETKTIGDGADPDHFDNRIEEDFMSFNYRRLSLNRYFKTAYSSIWVLVPYKFQQRSQIVTADCRAKVHAFLAIFDFVNE